ncbi:MAG: Cyclopropane-fatty-acyl-phospholipid synthase [uncultured Nocardioidaceae bacterium]|uniref:Cyclopropane-fatty-acyl-phospholipid synthase n=1 Tax=uncultured Nocardioidaceae bacterium TaxID=253824 RepID=A0A6J4LPT9_9ACTN|nr:MAG: Cyclopropane-fatty-acyl-phospholipid synthase [uncultured Nocardioidaceae bacterium]
MTLTDRPANRPTTLTAPSEGAAGRLVELVSPFFVGSPPIRIRAWDGSTAGAADAPTVVVRDPMALRRLVLHPGELGLAQAYVTGELDIEGDLLDALPTICRATREHGASATLGYATLAGAARTAHRLGLLGQLWGRPPRPPASQARLRGRLHSARRDQDAIAHHYDLSNDFYALILDQHMAYSCAYFTSADPDYTLEDAQRDKLDLVCRKLGLQRGGRHLDIGCGWGSLCLHAAEHYGVDVVAVTLSAEQRDFVRARVHERGLREQVDVRLQDYRDVEDGPFHTVSSIEMGEHVGAANYPTFTEQIHRQLRPGGRVLIQQMSRATRPGGGPFIESFIAPDMHMRPVGETVALMEQSGLEVRDVHAMREHYVSTIRAWYATFEANQDKVVALVGEEVARVWRLYLVGAALAFEEGRMGVDQILAVKPATDGRSLMPSVRTA